jgi:hypothetical protein
MKEEENGVGIGKSATGNQAGSQVPVGFFEAGNDGH